LRSIKKFPHVVCCQFGERMPCGISAWLYHIGAPPYLVDLLFGRIREEPENDVFKGDEANSHLHEFRVTRLWDLPAAVVTRYRFLDVSIGFFYRHVWSPNYTALTAS